MKRISEVWRPSDATPHFRPNPRSSSPTVNDAARTGFHAARFAFKGRLKKMDKLARVRDQDAAKLKAAT
jgi:hypothetical protein